MKLRIYLINRLRDLDWSTLALVVLLSASGLLAIYSIEVQHETSSGYFIRQVVWTILGLAGFFGAFFIPRKVIHNLAYITYGVGIFLLLIPIIMKQGGAVSRWITIGSFGIQPSEFMKIFL
ncbi:MAG: FtsW/RodA/SpoVE family cell cycle protein, partial [Candidatus Marinimicrobia bacterium]|nr:FtsW/RodA/SpoVE family cell cycle protein [Candidatus Neomarinimicrobiota bacterium]